MEDPRFARVSQDPRFKVVLEVLMCISIGVTVESQSSCI